jgi:hypothetical protein
MLGRNIYGDFDTTLKEYSIKSKICMQTGIFIMNIYLMVVLN